MKNERRAKYQGATGQRKETKTQRKAGYRTELRRWKHRKPSGARETPKA